MRVVGGLKVEEGRVQDIGLFVGHFRARYWSTFKS